MLLVDRILDSDDSRTTTLSIAAENWPLCTHGVVNPLILVELVAQTAGLHNGLTRMQEHGRAMVNRGWLVGIKKAVFHAAAFPVGARITTTSQNAFAFDELREVFGWASMDGRTVAEVTLQLVEAK
ncbi:MAG TPA: hypothetical protein VLT88_08575 [Desulfosarcina sp.]|nr:hypothetical protein [Desulfosarcina sp.]